LLTVVRQHVTG